MTSDVPICLSRKALPKGRRGLVPKWGVHGLSYAPSSVVPCVRHGLESADAAGPWTRCAASRAGSHAVLGASENEDVAQSARMRCSCELTGAHHAQDGPDKVFRIKGCTRGSSAAHGNVLADDVLVAVNGTATRELTIDQVRNLLVGPEGERVQLRLLRGHGTHAPTEVAVDLMRGTPELQERSAGATSVPSDVNSTDADDRCLLLGRRGHLWRAGPRMCGLKWCACAG